MDEKLARDALKTIETLKKALAVAQRENALLRAEKIAKSGGSKNAATGEPREQGWLKAGLENYQSGLSPAGGPTVLDDGAHPHMLGASDSVAKRAANVVPTLFGPGALDRAEPGVRKNLEKKRAAEKSHRVTRGG